MLTKNDFQNAKTRTTTLDIPELGGECAIRAISGEERGELAQLLDQFREDKMAFHVYLARSAALFLADELGARMFSESEADTLIKIEGAVLDHICDAGMEFNGFKKDSIADAEKNSEATVKNELVRHRRPPRRKDSRRMETGDVKPGVCEVDCMVQHGAARRTSRGYPGSSHSIYEMPLPRRRQDLDEGFCPRLQ